jgi:hypothetical protein
MGIRKNTQEPGFYWEEEDEEGNEVMTPLPVCPEVCQMCQGRGTHVHPSMYILTGSEYEEMSHDERDTFHSGGYDVECVECHGNKIVYDIDFDMLTPLMRDKITDWQDREASYRAMEESERRFGC